MAPVVVRVIASLAPQRMSVDSFPHSAAFWGKLPRATALRARPDIEERLDRLLTEAMAARPGFTVDARDFVAHWATHLSHCKTPESEFERLHLADLCLAFACGHGDPEALRMFQAEFVPIAISTVRGVDSSEAFVEEVTQQLLERILVASPGQPRVLEYAGRGSLEHWLRAAALRLALNARRSARRAPDQLGSDSQFEVAAPTADLQFDILQARFGADFGAALKEAMSDLSSQERSLLRLHFLDGLSFNQIGAVYQVNKSTISRRMSHAREVLLTKTRERLEKKFHLGAPEVESLMRMLGPELQLSLTSVLIHTPDDST
jgi:RNA polymerase sigma-70 factor (ECF subfamily)